MRPIDADEVKKRFPIMENDFGMVINETLHKELDKIPTLEVIPKAVYKNRLKSDLKTILEELQSEIDDEAWTIEWPDGIDERKVEMEAVSKIIQQKIDALEATAEDKE